jgi:hypothetical protein
MLVVLVLTLIMTLATAAASAGPVFSVMNTSEQPPDGVWFRNSPRTADTERVTGLGVYAGEQIRAVCVRMGEAVGVYGNRVWYYSENISRLSVGRRPNVGYLNTHYVNDGMIANQVAPGVPQCGSTPTPNPTPSVRAVYYSPFGPGQKIPPGGPAVLTRAKGEWTNPRVDCDTSRAIQGVPSSARTLSGWSIGRLGPIYYMARASAAQKQQINYVLLIDPGSYGELRGSCDNRSLQVNGTRQYRQAGQILASWLRANRSARLMVLAGDLTADRTHPVNGYAHAGIQNFYFNAIRAAGQAVRSRVLVCDYHVPGTDPHSNDSLNNSHSVMYNGSNRYVQQAPLTTCPSVSGAIKGASWRP